MKSVTIAANVEEICEQLRAAQRYRTQVLKSRIMIENRLVSTVAISQGYAPGLDEDERKVAYDKARELIRRVATGEIDSEIKGLILNASQAIEGFDKSTLQPLSKRMEKLAKRLPVAEWVQESQQRGFGMMFLAIIVGECGNLANYSWPGKVWRRLGLAPYTSNNKTLMGATWKSGLEGKLSAEEWEDFGYSPRRRSISYLIGEGIVKQNKSIYRERYDEKKAEAIIKHPEWKPIRAHRHGMICATKLLLKNLWIEWNPEMAGPGWID